MKNRKISMHGAAAWAIAMACSGGVTSQAFADVPDGFIDASTFGFDSADATAALQAAIDTGKNVYVPNMGSEWVVSPIMLNHSNQEILFESGVVVSAKRGEFMAEDDALFTASEKSNIKLTGYGATFVMHKSDYQQAPYEPAEWRHGINLLDAHNFEIYGLTIIGTGGDAIYIGTNSNDGYCKNIVVKDVVLDDNHRQGISIISVKNMMIDNAVVLNTDGTAPEAGIDFEPNFDTQYITNVTVKNTIVYGNTRYGILFAGPSKLPEPITVDIRNVTIANNHGDGIRMYDFLPRVTWTDLLIVGNNGIGIRGNPESGETAEEVAAGLGPIAIDHSAVWGNSGEVFTGRIRLGKGTVTDTEPLFLSTDPESPHFMYLDPKNESIILTGGSDGGFMGARPMQGADSAGTGSANDADGVVLK